MNAETKWAREEITVRVQYDPRTGEPRARTIPARLYGDLACHAPVAAPHGAQERSITHVPTGLRLPLCVASEECAMRLVEALSEIEFVTIRTPDSPAGIATTRACTIACAQVIIVTLAPADLVKDLPENLSHDDLLARLRLAETSEVHHADAD